LEKIALKIYEVNIHKSR